MHTLAFLTGVLASPSAALLKLDALPAPAELVQAQSETNVAILDICGGGFGVNEKDKFLQAISLGL